MQHKAGFVNIVGNPNVGKSTLMNQLVGEQIQYSEHFKAQTTRHRIMGIVNTPEAQVAFSDTPGVLKPNYKMQEMMLAFSESALADADILLYVTDVRETPTKNMDFLEVGSKMEIPVILLINKIDESEQNQLGDLVEKWHKLLPKAEILAHSSAKNKFGTEILMKRILELLPESPAYFDKDQLTDKPAKSFVSEIIPREGPPLLRQGDTLLRGGGRGAIQGGRTADPHQCRHLRGARQPKGHHHRPPGTGPQESIGRGTQVARAVLRQEDLPGDLRQGR